MGRLDPSTGGRYSLVRLCPFYSLLLHLPPFPRASFHLSMRRLTLRFIPCFTIPALLYPLRGPSIAIYVLLRFYNPIPKDQLICSRGFHCLSNFSGRRWNLSRHAVTSKSKNGRPSSLSCTEVEPESEDLGPGTEARSSADLPGRIGRYDSYLWNGKRIDGFLNPAFNLSVSSVYSILMGPRKGIYTGYLGLGRYRILQSFTVRVCSTTSTLCSQEMKRFERLYPTCTRACSVPVPDLIA